MKKKEDKIVSPECGVYEMMNNGRGYCRNSYVEGREISEDVFPSFDIAPF